MSEKAFILRGKLHAVEGNSLVPEDAESTIATTITSIAHTEGMRLDVARVLRGGPDKPWEFAAIVYGEETEAGADVQKEFRDRILQDLQQIGVTASEIEVKEDWLAVWARRGREKLMTEPFST